MRDHASIFPQRGCSDTTQVNGDLQARRLRPSIAPGRRRWSMLLVAAVLALAVLAAPAAGFAATQSSDQVDGVAASKRSLSASVAARRDDAGRCARRRRRQGALVAATRPIAGAMASITKIMTAVVALENARTRPRRSRSQGVRPGGRVDCVPSARREAAHGPGAGGAAGEVGQRCCGRDRAQRGRFRRGVRELMNEKAVELGLKNTHFANSHGLDAPGHYTTAADLAVLGRYAMTKPEFREIVEDEVGHHRVGRSQGDAAEHGPAHRQLRRCDRHQDRLHGRDAGYSVLSAAERDGI